MTSIFISYIIAFLIFYILFRIDTCPVLVKIPRIINLIILLSLMFIILYYVVLSKQALEINMYYASAYFFLSLMYSFFGLKLQEIHRICNE